MAPPRLILRFRELTPAVDTIRAHLEVIEKHGSVWWGWWKKETEPDHAADIRNLAQTVDNDHPVEVDLIDTSAERLHLAQVIQVRTHVPEAEKERVPAYYRDSIRDIPAWFLLSHIEADLSYDRALEEVIGQNTFATLPPT